MTYTSPPLDQIVGHGLSSEVFRHGPEHVLKLYKSPSDPNAIANEFRAARRAYACGLSVPKAVEIVERDGRTGIVFEAVQGRNLLRTYQRRPLAFLVALGNLAELHGAINAQDGSDLPSQHETLRMQITQARISDFAKREALRAFQNLPSGDRLCHGDLHPENVVCSSQGLCVIDWQKAARGNPAGDVARTAVLLRYGRLKIGRLGRYVPLDAIRAAITGFYIQRYCLRTGANRSEIRAWQLPVLAARLFGQAADNEDEVRATVERLAHRAAPEDRLPCGSLGSNRFAGWRKRETASRWPDGEASGCGRS